MSEDIHGHIEDLVAEEHRLWELEASGIAVEYDRERLVRIKVELDRYWDLLRRRRAAASLGANEENVRLRSEETVENYLQ